MGTSSHLQSRRGGERNFREFYSSYRKWFFKKDDCSKDQIVRQLMKLYRLAFQVSDAQTSIILLSEIWELFSQYFPRKKNKGNNKKGDDSDSISFTIRYSVSNMVRNKKSTKSLTRSQDNIFDMVRYLYNQRSIIVHQSFDETLDLDCIPLAFDMSRCLISKLISAPDKDIESIVKKIEETSYDKVPYLVPSIKLNPISDDLLDRVIRYAKFCKQQYEDSHPS